MKITANICEIMEIIYDSIVQDEVNDDCDIERQTYAKAIKDVARIIGLDPDDYCK